MGEQIAMFYMPKKKPNNAKRRWENAFQRWSDEQAMDGYTPTGCCGYGSMCDWCKDNSYGRPCVRALNSMLREKGKTLNYEDMNFEMVWNNGDTD